MMPRPVAVDEIRIEIELRWRDLDTLGHLNQAVYHELLEEGRAALFKRLGVIETDFFFVLARVELDYRHEVRRDHSPVAVVLRVEPSGARASSSGTRSCCPTGRWRPRAAPCSWRGTASSGARGR